MRLPITLNIVVEDYLTESIIKKILRNYENKFFISAILGKCGFGYIKNRIDDFNKTTKSLAFLIIADLDQYECPPQIIKEWLHHPKNPNLLFRIAVKEIESWLLADRINFAKYFAISHNLIPKDVELIDDPKNFLINLARKSPKRDIRESIAPKFHSTAKIGPNYNDCLSIFVQKKWQFYEAAKNSVSLMKTLNSLDNFKPSTEREK
jgi:hypothetical protein